MTDLANDVNVTSPRVAFWQHGLTAMLVLGFMVAGWLRLNDCDLFNPDSPRYLIYAQSLADTGHYRAVDTPGAPLYTWRPPGLPVLLAPVLRFFPYDVVAAKCMVLGIAALLLGLIHVFASSNRGGWSGPLMVAMAATSPLLLSLSTEVLSEVPYALGILLVLYCLSRWEQTSTGSRWGYYLVAMVALTFTPIIRTVGVALVVAVGLWSLTSRRRLALLPAVGTAVGGLAWLSWRSRAAGGSNYAGSLLQSIQEHGLMSVVADTWRTLSFYASAVPGVVLPGLTTGQPFYAPMVVGPLPSLSGFGVVAVVISLAMVLLAITGLWSQRSRGGLIGLAYLLLYGACLAIWPWRHERFLWPLVPMFLAYLPAGCAYAGQMLPRRVRLTAAPILVVSLLGICVWQSLSDVCLISTNQRFLANREAFLKDESPGFYFSDWRQAGRWIRENTAPHARVLTWQAAVGGTAHRLQRRVQFESLTPDKMRQQISAFPARYLVVTTAQFGLGFGWQQVFADPGYSLTEVYHDRDVAILEVGPNRSGSVSRTGYSDWIETQRQSLDACLAGHPDRTDLLIRKTDLLQEQGLNEEAIRLLQQIVDRGAVTVRTCSSLGWLYLAEQKYELAAKYLDLASGLPNAEPVAASLMDGANRARERLVAPADDSIEKQIERSLRRIQGLVTSLHLLAAEREVDRMLASAPDHGDLNYWRGYLYHLFCERDQAIACYHRAAEHGSQQAADKLQLLRYETALTQSAASVADGKPVEEQIDPSTFASHVKLAKLYDEHGWSGRAVAVLESARQRFGDRPQILSPLAELYLRFARPEQAMPLFKQALEAWPHDKSLRQGVATTESVLRAPKF